jgi:hypothetical protein
LRKARSKKGLPPLAADKRKDQAISISHQLQYSSLSSHLNLHQKSESGFKEAY